MSATAACHAALFLATEGGWLEAECLGAGGVQAPRVFSG